MTDLRTFIASDRNAARVLQLVVFIFCLLLASSLSATAQEAGQPIGGAAYRIGPEDQLEISVWKEEGLEREVLVRPDGGISFPLAGNMQAAGRTPAELEVEITTKIRKYIPDAVVSVSVSKISGYSVFVIGKVNNPGQFTVGRYLDVIQALTLAGGLTPYASEGKINVVRREDGREKVLPFDYGAVKRGRKMKQNIILKSGDVVVVP
ncbi:MAG: polysaccharide biosynthesis/export family protein [Gammaproteobacteria bacterium]